MRRVRTSTWVLLAIFLGVLVLYLWVKPPSPTTAGGSSANVARTTAPSHTRRPAPHRHRSPAPAATPAPHRTATPRPTGTPQPTATPTTAPPTSPAPTPSATTSVTGAP
jgi:hypothetical protein